MSKQGLTTQFTPTRIKKITHIHLHAYQHLRAHTTSIRHTPTRLTFWSAMAMSVQLAVLKRALKVRKPASMDACQSSRFSSCTSNGSRGATRPSTPCSEGWLHARVCMYVCCVCVCMCVCVIRFSSCISISPQEALSCAMDRRVSHNLQMYIIITCAALTPRHSLW